MEEPREFPAYTYYLYHIPTGKKYYGSRTANQCEPEQDLWNEYFSSSDLVGALVKEYGEESFRAEVRKTFDTAQEARDWEDQVHHRMNVVEREDWLNQACAHGHFFCVTKGRKPTEKDLAKMRRPRPHFAGENNHFFNKKHSEKSLVVMRQKAQERVQRKEWKEKQRIAQLAAYERGRPTNKGRKIWSKYPHPKGMKDKHHTEEIKQQIAESVSKAQGGVAKSESHKLAMKEGWRKRREDLAAGIPRKPKKLFSEEQRKNNALRSKEWRRKKKAGIL